MDVREGDVLCSQSFSQKIMYMFDEFGAEFVTNTGHWLCVKLVNTYVMSSREITLNTAACRLLLNIMPGLETAVVFQEKVWFM